MSRKSSIQSLISQYEQELGSTLNYESTFDSSRLPPFIKQVLDLVVAKTPSFSNVSALATANHALAHITSQTRARIDDLTFASSPIGANLYNVNVSGSGSGKSSTARYFDHLFKPALQLVNDYRNEAQIVQAKQIALKELQKDEPDLLLEHLKPVDYEAYLKPLTRTTLEGGSTRGGIAGILSALQLEDYASVEILFDELGMELKSGQTTDEVMKLLTESYDSGSCTAPAFKHAENQEISITEQYVNVLAHTSPRIIFSDPRISERFSVLYSTSFARRTFFFFPDEAEADENNPVPETIAAKRELRDHRRSFISQVAPAISEHITKVITDLLANPDNRIIKFTPAAATLYEDYFDYCALRAELMEDSSILQIEMAGRTWKLGKLAGVWALAEGTQITKQIMEGVIYLAEYSTKYLEKFVHLTTAKPYELMYQFFTEQEPTLTLDSAISRGYIQRISPDFKDILDPLNSKLTGKGIVQYDQDLHTFIYEQFQLVEPTPPDKPACHFAMSYKLCPDVPKSDRTHLLGSFDKFRDDLCFDNLANLLQMDTIFNPFHFKEVDGVPHKRNTASIQSSTNLIVLDVDDSPVSLEAIHDYLLEYDHLIATTSNPDNLNKFRILLPINMHLDGTNPKQYSYVVKRIAADLLLDIDPASAVAAQAFYGYNNSIVHQSQPGNLYDITYYVTEHAAGEELKPTKQLVKPRSPKSRKAHADKLMDNIEVIFEYAISPESNWSFQLARASKHLLDEGLTRNEYLTCINYIHERWEDGMMDPQRFQTTILDQFTHLFPAK